MLAQPIQLLPKVKDTLRHLSEHHTLIMITKGDLLDQQKKVRGSGLWKYFPLNRNRLREKRANIFGNFEKE